MTTSSPACARCPPMIEPSDPAPRMRTFITPNAHAQPPDGDHPEPTVRSSVLDNRRSFYYLIRPQQERWRDVESQSLRSLEIDHQLELRGLLDRQVGGFRSLQNLVHVGGEESIHVRDAGAVTHEAAGLDEFPPLEDTRQAVSGRQVDDPLV